MAAVFHSEVDERAAEAPQLAATLPPDEALEQWITHYATFIVTKRGLAAALHYRDPAFNSLPGYFMEQLGPVLAQLLDSAARAGTIREGVDPLDLPGAVAKLCIPLVDSDDNSRAVRMVAMSLTAFASVQPDAHSRCDLKVDLASAYSDRPVEVQLR